MSYRNNRRPPSYFFTPLNAILQLAASDKEDNHGVETTLGVLTSMIIVHSNMRYTPLASPSLSLLLTLMETALRPRTQKKIRALEKQIIEFTDAHKKNRADRLKKQIADDFWKELLEQQSRTKGASEKKKHAKVEAEYHRNLLMS